VIDRRGLETLVAVVDAGTFDLAAQRLRVTPSAISQRIKAIETEQGRVLLERTKPIRPTADGEVLLRLGRQIALLEDEAAHELGAVAGTMSLPLAVNADSLATWLLPALARATAERPIVVEVLREDQERTAALLASGRVMAAVTSDARAVPGCTVSPLGRMRYRAMATPAFVAEHLPAGATRAGLAAAPLVDFDRDDELQSRWLRAVTRAPLDPPRHRIAGSAEFAQAIALGMGWGMLTDAQARPALAAGALVELDPRHIVDVPLFWQQWNLRAVALDAIAAEVVRSAREALVQR
jgi:LysR family transcriptional regulator, chromosome initiation inhibitor